MIIERKIADIIKGKRGVLKKYGDIEHKIPTERWTNFLDFSKFGFDEVLISLVR